MGSGQSLGLPRGKGPHQVGCTDVMTDHTRKGCFFRLYYPCHPSENTEQPLWMPRYEYCGGLADYVNLNFSWCAPILSMTFGSYRVPVCWNADVKQDDMFPLIIFSHGLGAFRTIYSAVCMDMASWGFLVAAVEHRDQSASMTYYLKPKSEYEKHNEEETPDSTSSQYQLQEEWLPFRKLKLGEKEFRLRNPQVHQRANECVRALRLLKEINSGTSVDNVLHKKQDLSMLKGRIDVNNVAVMGHSFGAATAILAQMKHDDFKCAVALDAWMLPLENQLYPKFIKPVFFINSERFQTAENVTKIKRLCSTNRQIKIITILGTVHQSQTDFTFLTGHVLSRIFQTKGTIDPYVALEINNRAALAFLSRHLDLKEDFGQWDALVEGDGEHIIPDTPFQISSL